MSTANLPRTHPQHRNIFYLLMQGMGLAILCLGFSLGTLLTHPQIYAQASSADGLALFDLAHDILNGTSLASWNFPRAPTFFPDTLITLIGLSFSRSILITIAFIATINTVFLSLVFWFILKKYQPAPRASLIKTSIVVLLSITTTVTLLPDSFSTIFYQLFTTGTHLASTLLAMLMVYLLQEKPSNSLRIPYLITLWVLSILGGLSNPMITVLVGLWIGKQTLSDGWKITLLKTQNQLVILGLCLGSMFYLALPRQSLSDSFLSTHHWLGNIQAFALHLFSTPSALIFFGLLIAATLIWPFLENGLRFNGRNWVSTYLRNDFAILSLSIIGISPVMYQEWTSLRYLIFPTLIFLLCCSVLFIRLLPLAIDKKFNGVSLIFYLSISTILILYFFSSRPIDASSYTLTEQLRCIKKARATYPLKDGVASYWHARTLRYGSGLKDYIAQVRPLHPQLGFFFWGNNGIDFIYADRSSKLLRDYNYIIASDSEIENNLWGQVLKKASGHIQCEGSSLYFYSDSVILWNYLFGKNQKIIPNTLPGLVKKQDEFLQHAPQIFTANDLYTQVGQLRGQHIDTTLQSGYLVYGPYIHLAPGSYQLTLNGSFTEGIVEISFDGGKALLIKQPLTAIPAYSPASQVIEFSTEQEISNVEFRVVVSAKSMGSFKSFELKKL